jgi:hypothetical protein
MRVRASTIEHVFPNLGAVKYCILHQNCGDFQAPSLVCDLKARQPITRHEPESPFWTPATT